jgi:hypothetical protein
MKLLIAQLKTKRSFIKYGPLRAMFIPDDGGSTQLWNVGPRRQFWTVGTCSLARCSECQGHPVGHWLSRPDSMTCTQVASVGCYLRTTVPVKHAVAGSRQRVLLLSGLCSVAGLSVWFGTGPGGGLLWLLWTRQQALWLHKGREVTDWLSKYYFLMNKRMHLVWWSVNHADK